MTQARSFLDSWRQVLSLNAGTMSASVRLGRRTGSGWERTPPHESIALEPTNLIESLASISRVTDRTDVVVGMRGHRYFVRTASGANQYLRLLFDDGSALKWDKEDNSPRLGSHAEGLGGFPADSHSRLLEPITGLERDALERILSILGEARSNEKLTRWQEDQIILMADLIRAARDDAVPEETERWKVIGVVGGALHYLARELPEDVVKWGAAAVVLTNIDWTNLAQALPG